MNCIVMMGPPGVGKGTQAARLAEWLGVPAVSTGDLFRAHVRSQSELGRQSAALIAAGEYVPDSITNAMVAQRLAETDAQAGLILDGYPRTPAQVGELDRMLAQAGGSVTAVVGLAADTAEILERLTLRAATEGRADDTEDVIRRRLEVYQAETAPLAALYEERGLYARIDGLGTPDTVHERIRTALASST